MATRQHIRVLQLFMVAPDHFVTREEIETTLLNQISFGNNGVPAHFLNLRKMGAQFQQYRKGKKIIAYKLLNPQIFQNYIVKGLVIKTKHKVLSPEEIKQRDIEEAKQKANEGKGRMIFQGTTADLLKMAKGEYIPPALKKPVVEEQPISKIYSRTHPEDMSMFDYDEEEELAVVVPKRRPVKSNVSSFLIDPDFDEVDTTRDIPRPPKQEDEGY